VYTLAKNALFLKNWKVSKRLACLRCFLPDPLSYDTFSPDPLAFGGWRLCSQTPSSKLSGFISKKPHRKFLHFLASQQFRMCAFTFFCSAI